jgi:hypothetical protein
MAKPNTIILQEATLDDPEEQFRSDVMVSSHTALLRLAFLEVGLFEFAPRQVRVLPSDPAVPGLRAFGALIKDGGDQRKRISKIRARLVANFNQAHRELQQMRMRPIDGNRRQGAVFSLVDWHDPRQGFHPPAPLKFEG